MEFEVCYRQYGQRKYEVVEAANQGEAIEKVKAMRIGANSFYIVKVSDEE